MTERILKREKITSCNRTLRYKVMDLPGAPTKRGPLRGVVTLSQTITDFRDRRSFSFFDSSLILSLSELSECFASLTKGVVSVERADEFADGILNDGGK